METIFEMGATASDNKTNSEGSTIVATAAPERIERKNICRCGKDFDDVEAFEGSWFTCDKINYCDELLSSLHRS